jgi:hypothetical protein
MVTKLATMVIAKTAEEREVFARGNLVLAREQARQ